MLPVRAGAGAGGSPKAALIVEVLVDLFSEHFAPGVEMSDPERSRCLRPVIWGLRDTSSLLERKTSAKPLLTALEYIEARIKKSERASNSSTVEEGVAFAGQCWIPGSWQAAGSEGQSRTRLDAGQPLSSCSQHIGTLLQQVVSTKRSSSVTHALHLPAGLILLLERTREQR